MKKNILLFILLGMFHFVKAQVSYTTKDYNNDLAPFKISASFLNFENFITPVTAGVMIDGHLGNKIFYNAQLRIGYVRNFFVPKDQLITMQKESKGNYLEGGIDLPFYNNTKSGKLRIVTSSVNNGTTITESYFNAVCDKRVFWALSGGVFMFNRAQYYGVDSNRYIISNNQKLIPSNEESKIHYNVNTVGLYVGLSHKNIRKAIVKSDGWRYRRYYSTKFYVHLLIGNTGAQDILLNNTSYKIDNTKQIPLGYRIGWQWDQMGVITGVEFGNMPNVKLDVPPSGSPASEFKFPFNYTRLTFHFSIYNNDKNYHMKGTQD